VLSFPSLTALIAKRIKLAEVKVPNSLLLTKGCPGCYGLLFSAKFPPSLRSKPPYGMVLAPFRDAALGTLSLSAYFEVPFLFDVRSISPPIWPKDFPYTTAQLTPGRLLKTPVLSLELWSGFLTSSRAFFPVSFYSSAFLPAL